MTSRILKGLVGVLLGYNCTMAQIQAVGETFFSKEGFKEFEKTANDYNAAYFDHAEIFSTIENSQEFIKNNLVSERQMRKELKNERVVILADSHCFTAQHKKMMEIVSKIKTKRLVLGLESFSTDEQGYIDDYFSSKMCLEDIISKTKYTQSGLEKYGYTELYKLLKKKKVKTVGIDMPHFVEDEVVAENSVEVLIRRYFIFDFYNRDLTAAKTARDVLEEGNNILIIIGGKHAESNHLPYMMKKLASQRSAIVFQQPYDISKCADPLKEYKRFRKLGLIERKALRIEGEHIEFYLNVKPNMKEWEEYRKEE